MKISKLLVDLQSVLDYYGDIEVDLFDSGMYYESFCIVPEDYDETEDSKSETVCHLRTWPY